MMDARNITTSVLALSLFSLAASITYFTYKLNVLSDEIPIVLESVNNTSDKIEPLLKEITELRKIIPSIVNEAAEIRKQIPPILKEVAEVRVVIPVISKKIDDVSILIPILLEDSKEFTKLIPGVLAEVKKTREAIPPILIEVKKTREAIPPMLDKADMIVANARSIGKTTSEGAVTGFFTGIIKAPFRLVGGLKKSIFGNADLEKHGVTEKDQELAVNMLYEMLGTATINESRSWSNPETGNKGTLVLAEIKTINNQQCRVLDAKTIVKGKEISNKTSTYCLNDKDEWAALE